MIFKKGCVLVERSRLSRNYSCFLLVCNGKKFHLWGFCVLESGEVVKLVLFACYFHTLLSQVCAVVEDSRQSRNIFVAL